MEKKKADRRIYRTKRLIRDALSVLMEEKSFEEITVKDITEKADINRGTFYLHYQDKYDLLEQSEDEVIKEIQKLGVESINFIESWKTSVIETPLPFIINVFEYFKKNAVFLKSILGPKGTGSFLIKFKSVLSTNLMRIKKTIKGDTLVPEEYLISYIVGAHISVLQQWLGSGMKETPDEMALILSRMTGMGPAFAAGLRTK
ncbi:TetR/AcrR family transcriptional regulator [Bacillus changyiensis]|uniref:TetR/AcrR family transcriptional regulator n=1 Tax=Bacillus changyiensis TaxID=3004103 RepID=UPI0022DF8D6B|nr:TetR/AcrR family transcriptional regulator C-terminal domain-containing protein [Bacillus changyiensis]MDA1475066.1 TetR/AcrR family transcriptional regulator C-terminal domain-containing protein [Bacillus changyiensis]